MLAHHYAAALEFAAAAGLDTDTLAEPARLALRDGADRAFALGSYRQADRLYSAALALWPEGDSDRSVLVLRRAHARNDFNMEVDTEGLEAALDRFIAEGRLDLAADAEMLLAKRAWTAGQGASAREHGDRALELVRGAPGSPAKAEVLVERARQAMLAADYDRAQELGAEGLATAEALGLDRLRASALITMGSHGGDARVELLEHGLALALELNDVQQIQRGYNNLGEQRLRLGQVAMVGDLYEELRRTTDRLGVVFRWQEAQEADYYYRVGTWDRAEPLLEAFLAAVEAGSPHYQESIARFVRADIRYARGETEGAFDDAERGTAAARSAGDPQIIAGLAMHALLLLGEGRAEAASALIDEVIEAGFFDYYLVLDFALAMAELGRGDEIAGLLADADFGEPWQEAGRALTAGDFAGAASAYADLGIPTHEAYARLRAAANLVTAGRRREADEHLGRALAFYRSVGATRYIREGEGLMAASA
jgi:hypothetical protein